MLCLTILTTSWSKEQSRSQVNDWLLLTLESTPLERLDLPSASENYMFHVPVARQHLSLVDLRCGLGAAADLAALQIDH
jgi:hypothetical protein